MVVDAEGRAYVGNLGWDDEHEDRIRSTVLIRVDPDGAATVVADDLVNPNGMAITPDGRTLLVNETFAARTTAFDIGPNGSLAGGAPGPRTGPGSSRRSAMPSHLERSCPTGSRWTATEPPGSVTATARRP